MIAVAAPVAPTVRPQFGHRVGEELGSYGVVPKSPVNDCEVPEHSLNDRPETPPVVELSALELHRRLTGLQRLSDRTRLEFLRVLAAFDEGRRYLELGFATAKQYLIRKHRLGRSNALELIRVARRLPELPLLAEALGAGRIHWSDLKAASRVATTETEEAWLQLIENHTLAHVEHEVKRAAADRRDAPAEESEYGLTNLMTRISFEMTLEEKERFETAMRQVAATMGDDSPTDLASVLLFLSQQILEGRTVSSRDGETGSSGAASQVIVYHQCPDCAVSTVDTADGPVDVAPETVDRLTDIAEQTTITAEDLGGSEDPLEGELDPPNSTALARKIRHRDGLRCANPGCDHREGLQAHHIHFRSKGGRTTLSNETTLCRRCHTLIHAGLVRIEREPGGKLIWVPRLRDMGQLSPFDPFPDLADLPNAAPLPPQAESGSRHHQGVMASPEVDLEALVGALGTLGYRRKDARQRVEAALERMLVEGSESVDETKLLNEALRRPA